MAANPSASITFADGQLQAELQLGTGVPIKIGPATGGPLLRPVLCSSVGSVLQFLHGPLVASGAHHVTYSGFTYLMRANASILGSIGSVTKTPASTGPASLASLAASLTSYTLNTVDAIVASVALNLTTGWAAPSAVLPVTVTAGGGTVAHTLTFTYIDTNDEVQTGTLSVTGAGAFTTTFSVKSILSVTSNIAPVGTQTYTSVFTTPADRYAVKVKSYAGGVFGVTGGTTPKVQISLDNGQTYSNPVSMPSSGTMELTTYAGGLAAAATGVTLTFSPSTTAAGTIYGSLRAPGAVVTGDVVYTKKVSSAVTVTHVVNTVPTAFNLAVAAPAITVTANTAGGTASSFDAGTVWGGGNFDTIFTVSPVGVGGDAIQIRTVSAGAFSVVVAGNNITVNYDTGVTTVAVIEAAFPVVTTFGTVSVGTPGTGANILADPGDTHGYAPFSGGVDAAVVTTANDIVTAIQGSVPASALVDIEAVGVGTGLMAAMSVSGFANSQMEYTPKVEGVTIRHGNPGPSNAAISIAISSKAITVNPVTDVNGIQTSTASAIKAAVNAHASASLLVSAEDSGTGAGIVGMQNSYTSLAVSIATGDVWSFATTPPTMSNADIAEAQAALTSNDAVLDGFECAHFLGDATDTDLALTDTWIRTLESEKRKYKWAIHEATWMGSTNENTWISSLLTGYTPVDVDPVVKLSAGECDTYNPAYATWDRRNVGTAYMARTMICPISEFPSHVDCETDVGIQNAVQGTKVRTSTTTASVTPLWQTEDGLVQLNAANFITFRTWSGRTGLFVRQSLMFTTNSDYTFGPNRRIANVGAATAYDEIVRNVNRNMLVDPTTGQLLEIEIQRIEGNVETRVRRTLMGGQRQHISAVKCVVQRGTDFVGTGAISGKIKMVPRIPATSISMEIGYVRSF